MKIQPFDRESEATKAKVAQIMMQAPVKNLTEAEVLETLRLIDLHVQLRDKERTKRFSVTVWQDDERLQDCSDEDKFLALLLDADTRGVILTTKRCRYCFGGAQWHWMKIARACSLIYTKSIMVDNLGGGRYYGKGWVLAPNIVTLRRWIIENSASKEVQELKED